MQLEKKKQIKYEIVLAYRFKQLQNGKKIVECQIIDNLISLCKVMEISLDELVMGENDISDIKKGAINQRNKNCTLYFISILIFLIAGVCWIIFVILNISNGNDAAAVLSGINIIILAFPIGVSLRKYLEIKEQGNSTD